MPKSVTISKSNSFFPQHLEFKQLRTIGIQHIAELSGKLWTDHNSHDPGITILEVLCYALTDLAYRNNLDIKDLLAQDPLSKKKEDNFFKPAEILSCNPLTINDYRKLLIDTEGVRNAWLQPATDAEVDFYVDCQKQEFSFEKKVEPTDGTSPYENKPVKINGLYKVMLELEPYLTIGQQEESCDINETSIGKVFNKVKQKLHLHRNLSEDFLEVHILKDECIGVNSSIELEPEADPEDVLLAIYNQLDGFFQTSITFYTLQEMLDRGKSMEEVFAGRPLTYDSFGFVDIEDLEKLQRFEEVHASDIQSQILKVKGVRAIRNLNLSSWIGESRIRSGEQWCLPLTNANIYRPLFCPEKSDFCFFKGVLPFNINKQEVNEKYSKLNSNFSKAKKTQKDLDSSIPQGQYRSDLGEYYSIQNDFPTIYQVGPKQLPIQKGKRRAQALQMKSYLLFFDQILANYLAQLSTLRDTFSLNPSIDQSTYAFQNPDMVPGIELLLKNFNSSSSQGKSLNELNEGETLAVHPQQYESPIQRDEAVRKLLANFQSDTTRVKTDTSDCGVFYEILNGTEKVWLRGTKFYKKEKEAVADGEALQFIASNPQSYRLINRASSKEYSFELIYNPQAFQSFLNEINESPSTSDDRRNRFLNHLMARFGEHFTDYVLLMYAMYGEKQDSKTILQDKVEFLKSYPDISRNRGRSFNYCDKNIWNSSNITGLENKVTKLMGINDWKRSNLNNFEIVSKERSYVFNVKDQHGKIVFVSKREFRTVNLAEEAYFNFLDQLKDDQFKIIEINCSMDGAFGFKLFNEAKCEELFHPDTYSDATFRTERAGCLIEYLKGDCIIRRTESSDDGYYFFLKKDEEIIFKSEENYKDEESAMQAFHLFINAAQQTEGFQSVKSKYSRDYSVVIVVTNEEGEFQNIARSIKTFSNKKKAKKAIEEWNDWILESMANFEIINTAEVKVWTFEDKNENVLLQSALQFKNESHAIDNYFYVLSFAKEEDNYLPVEKQVNNEIQFGFELQRKGADGDLSNNLILAQHPQFYATANERDKVLENTLKQIKERGLLKEFILQDHNKAGVSFQLVDDEEEILIKGTQFYRNRILVGTAWKSFFVTAKNKNNFRIRSEEGFCECIVELWNSDKLIAIAPNAFNNKKDALTHIEKVVALVKQQPPIFIEKVKGLWGFHTFDKNREVDKSNHLFKTRSEAVLAFLEKSKDLNIQQPIQIKTIVGKWKMNLRDSDNELLLEGDLLFPSEKETQLYQYYFLNLAKEYAKYGRVGLADSCLFEIELYDDSIEAIATHPHSYETQKECQKKIDKIIEYVEKHCFDFEIKSSSGSYHTEIWWEDCGFQCEPLLVEINSHDNKSNAIDVWDTIATQIKDGEINLEVINVEGGMGFSISAMENGELSIPIASHPASYSTEEEAEKIKDLAIGYLKSAGNSDSKFKITTSDAFFNDCEIDSEWKKICDWVQASSQDLEQLKEKVLPISEISNNEFTIQLINLDGNENPVFATHTRSFKSEDAAMSQRDIYFDSIRKGEVETIDPEIVSDDTLPKSGILDSFILEKEKDLKVYQLRKEEYRIATHTRNYSTELELDQFVNSFCEDLNLCRIDFCEPCLNGDVTIIKNKKFHFVVSLKNDAEILWQSAQGYFSRQEAVDALNQQYIYIFELARKRKSYMVMSEEEDYFLAISDKEKKIVVEGITRFSTEDEAKLAILDLIDCAIRYPIFRNKKHFGFRWYNSKTEKFDWTSSCYYKTPKLAWKDFLVFVDLLQNKDNYLLKGDKNCGYTFEIGEILLQSKNKYQDSIIQERLKQFLALSQLDNSIVSYTDYTNGCQHGFHYVGEKYRLARHPKNFYTLTEREEKRDCLFHLKTCDKITFSNLEMGCTEQCGDFYFYINDNNGNKLWRSCDSYATREEAKAALQNEYLDILNAARKEELYITQEIDESTVITLLNPTKTQVIAIVVYTLAKPENLIQKLLEKVSQDLGNKFSVECDPDSAKFYFVIKDEEGRKLWRSYQSYSTKTIAEQQYNILFDDIMTAAREPDFYQFEDSEDPTAIELLHPSGKGAIALVVDYEEDQPQIISEDIILKRILTARKYPVTKLAQDDYGFQIYSEGCNEITNDKKDDQCDFIIGLPSYYEIPGEVIWENISSYPTHQDAWRNANILLEDILDNKNHYSRIDKGCEQFGLEIVNPNEILATHPRRYTSKNELEAAILKTKSCLNTEGLHVIEHVLLRPRFRDDNVKEFLDCEWQIKPSILEKMKPCVDKKIFDCAYPQDERGGDEFDVFEDYIPGADPFSFWVTIVLPFWSERFQNPNFRTFFEGTLRREVPAHIALRIAWVDPQQMKEFEEAYKDWLEVLADPEHCDFTERQCRLLEILFNLKNVYPTGRLLDQSQVADDAGPIVLGQTTIG